MATSFNAGPGELSGDRPWPSVDDEADPPLRCERCGEPIDGEPTYDNSGAAYCSPLCHQDELESLLTEQEIEHGPRVLVGS